MNQRESIKSFRDLYPKTLSYYDGFKYASSDKKVKCRSLQIGIYVVVFVSLVTSSYILLNGTRYILDPNPAGKTEYEIAVYMDSEYAVISEYGDKVLVVPLVKNDTEPVLLDAKLYRFIGPSECEFYCINFGHIPTVDKRDTLDNSPS